MGLLVFADAERYGHCIRLSERWILTAHHVVDIPELAARFQAERFGFLTQAAAPGHSYALDPLAGFFCSDDGIQGPHGHGFDLDYAFIRLAELDRANDPSGKVALSASAVAPAIGSRAYVPQFNCVLRTDELASCDTAPPPSGGEVAFRCMQPLRVEHPCYDHELMPYCPRSNAQPGTFTVCDDPDFPYLYHLASTEPGCSGAPIFNAEWQLVGLHTHGWSCTKHYDPVQKVNNWGTRIACIARDAAKRGFDLSEIPCLLPLLK